MREGKCCFQARGGVHLRVIAQFYSPTQPDESNDPFSRSNLIALEVAQGTQILSPASVAVPEPATALLAFVALRILDGIKRRRC